MQCSSVSTSYTIFFKFWLRGVMCVTTSTSSVVLCCN